MITDSTHIADTVLDAFKAVSSPTFEDAARSIFNACKKIVGASSGYVALLNKEGSRNEVLYLDSGGLPCTVAPDLPMPVRGLRAVAYETGTPVFDNRFRESGYSAFLPEGHMVLENVLFAPMLINNTVAGLIGLANKNGGFNEKDAEIAAILANGAGLALEKSKLCDELAEKDKSLQRLCDELQDRIEERTAQLSAANTRLQDHCEKSRQIADNLQKSEARYRDVVETIDEGVILQEASGTIVTWNKSAERIFGLSAEEVIGSNPTEREWPTIHEDGSKFHSKDHPSQITLQTGKAYNNVIMGITRKDGELRWVSINTKPVFKSGEKQPSAVVISFRDITEQRNLENQLRQSQKMEAIGTLAGGIAHEFNNILTGILNYAEIVREDTREGLPVQDSINEIVQLGDRAKNVVRQIMSFSRAGKSEKKSIQPHILIKEELKMLRAMIPSNIIIHHDIQAAGTINGDAVQMQQIIMNLCTNAAQAMQQKGGGTIHIRLESVVLAADSAGKQCLKPGRHMKLTVSDTGPGIDRKNINRIFDPFFTTKPVGSGTGMGLAIVHGIVREYQGAVSVSSTPNEGATFTVLIPAASEEAGQLKRKTELPCGTERVLIVDDEEFVVFPLKKILERLGYRVTALTNSLEALDLFTKNPALFDLVITDLTMPHLTGEHLTQKMIQIRPDLRVVLMTGYSDMIDNERIKQSGIKAFVPKPCRKENLAKTVRLVLDGN